MTQDKTRFSRTIREFEYEKAGLEKPLANEQQLYAIMTGSFEEEKKAHEKSQAEIVKGKELSAEAEENENALLKALKELRRENSQWTKDLAKTGFTVNKIIEERVSAIDAAKKEIEVLRVEKAAIIQDTRDDLERCKEELADSKEEVKPISGLHESADDALDAITSNVDKVTAENIRLGKELNDLETVTTNVEKLTADNARLEEQLADSKSTDHQARSDEHAAGLREDFRKFHEENSHLKKELDTATENVEKLTADNARLEEELAESKKTVDQRYSNEYVADLLGGMEQLQNELNSSQPSQQVKDAEIRELAFENSRLKEELPIARENLGLSPFSSCRHSLIEDGKARIERMLDEEPRASDSDAGAKASTSNNNKTFAKDTYGTLYTIPKTNGNDYDWIQDVDVDFLELDNSDAESWCMGDPTPTSRSQNSPKESDVDAM